MKEWEVHGWRPDGEFGPLAGGPESTFPSIDQRKSMRSAGCKIYVDGKLYKEAETEPKNTRTKKKK